MARRRKLLRKAFGPLPPTALRQMLKFMRQHPSRVLLDGRISSREGKKFCPLAASLPGVEDSDWISVLSIDPGWRNFNWNPTDGPCCLEDALNATSLAEVVEVAKDFLRQKVARQRARARS
jgi:hypothetical protein